MVSRRQTVVLLALIVLTSVLAACGPGAPKTDIEFNARVLEIHPDRNMVRIAEYGSGRKYEMLVTETSEILMDKQPLALTDLKTFYQIRIWANKVSGKEFKYEVVRIDVLDTGEAAPSRR